MEAHVAVLVLNRNMREMTEKLIDVVRATSKSETTIYSLEAASDEGKTARNSDIKVYFHENKRWAWSFAWGMHIAVDLAKGLSFPTSYPEGTYTDASGIAGSPKDPTHFWLICNDAQLDPTSDTLNVMLQNMPADACQIHPYQTTHPQGSPQGWAGFNRIRTGRRVHNVAFVEFVCPLITRDFYDRCIANFGCPPVGPHFPYGWGVDYEMAYFGHKLGLKSYICDMVGITHHPGTTHQNHEKTKVEDNNRMRVLARNTMLDVLEQRYGRNWGDLFAETARSVGVDPHAFLEWSKYDRALALQGTRV